MFKVVTTNRDSNSRVDYNDQLFNEYKAAYSLANNLRILDELNNVLDREHLVIEC